jgi:hypothetical protein
MSPPLARVSAAIPSSQRDELEALGGPDGISAGVRMAVAAGLSALRAGDPAATACLPLEELHALADRLASVTGRRTPSGALWCPSPDSLPDLDSLVGDEVLVCPHGLVLVGGDHALSLDMEVGEVRWVIGNGEVATPITLEELGLAACLLPSALAGLAAAGHGSRMLPPGMRLAISPDRDLELSHRGAAIRLGFDAAWILASEVVSLWTRRCRLSAEARQTLERQLAEVGR